MARMDIASDIPSIPPVDSFGQSPVDIPDGQAAGWSALTINVILEPVGIDVPTGSFGATRHTGDTLPIRRQRTSKDELSTNEVIVFGPAEDVTVDVASSADFAGDVTVGVTSSDDR